MALEESGNNMVMPVSPMMNGGMTDGFGFGNGNGWWILLLFILLGGNAWGNGYGNGAVPQVGNEVQRGFDQASVMNGVSSIQSDLCNGFAGVNNALCNGFAGVNATVSQGFSAAEANANARQIANMQQAFAAQTAVAQGMNGIASNLQNCCCENRANVADLKYTVATENCADRQALSDGLRDLTANNTYNTQAILNAINGGIQSIKDDLCADRLEAVKMENQNLRTQLNMANLAASQGAQTAQILNDNLAQTQAIEQYLAPVPRPSYIVNNPNGCGCNQNSCCGM